MNAVNYQDIRSTAAATPAASRQSAASSASLKLIRTFDVCWEPAQFAGWHHGIVLPQVDENDDPANLKWLPELYLLVDKGKTRLAVKLLYSNVDKLLRAERFDQCDELFRTIRLDRLDATTMVGILTITGTAKGELPGRARVFEKIRKRLLLSNPDRVEQILAGLD